METESERLVVTRRDHLELRPWRVPAPAAGQVLVRVEYSAVSYGDIMLRRQVFRRRPAVAVPGYEVVGTVLETGPGVQHPRPGDRIAAFVEYGGNARHALVSSRDVVPIPAGVDGARSAAVVLNYATAFGMLDVAGLVPGDDLLIHGASGGVGTAVLDVSRGLGLRTLGTVRRELPIDLFGAQIFDVRSPGLVEAVRAASNGGVRAVFDPRAGRGLWRSRAMVRGGGALIVFGLSAVARRGLSAALGTAGSLASLALFRALPGKRTRIFAIDRTHHRQPALVRDLVQRAIDALARGSIAPVIGAISPLADVPTAHQLMESGRVVGKIVVDCR